MTSTFNLSRTEAVNLQNQLNEILNNKELNSISIVQTGGQIFVTRSTDGLSPLIKKQTTADIHDCTDAD